MNTVDLHSLARMLDLQAETVTGNVMMLCPFSPWLHGKSRMQNPPGSMSLQVSEGESKWHCFACNRAGHNLYGLLFQINYLGFFKARGGEESYKRVLAFVEAREKRVAPSRRSYEDAVMMPRLVSLYSAPPEDVPMYDDGRLDRMSIPLTNPAASPALAYLRDRHVLPETWETLEIRYDQLHDRVVFPVRWFGGQLVGALGRLIHPPREIEVVRDGKKVTEKEKPHHTYWNFPKGQVLHGEHLLRPEPVVVVEGPFDHVRVRQAGFNVVDTAGAGFAQEQADKLVEFGQPVVIFYDPDRAGQINGDKLHSAIVKQGGRAVLYLPVVLGKDAGSHTEEEVKAALGPLIESLSGGLARRVSGAPIHWD
jgi:hypothetical protein